MSPAAARPLKVHHPLLATPDGKPREEFFAKDRIHLAPPGHAKWAELVRPVLEKLGVKK